MDPLSDVLRVLRLSGAYFYAIEASGPWQVDVMAGTELSARVLPDGEHLISYHILTQGRCWAGGAGEAPVEMSPGDVIVFLHGDAHVMGSAPGPTPGAATYGRSVARYPQTVRLGEGGPPETILVCAS